MKTVHKSVLIWYSPEEMFQLVTDVERYPEFLPWCNKGIAVEQWDTGMLAEIGISFMGIHQTWRTRNEHIPGREVRLHLEEGPFSRLEGKWTFTPLGTGEQRACKVELELHYGFEHSTLGRLVSPVFDKIAGTMVDAFVKRAEQVYG